MPTLRQAPTEFPDSTSRLWRVKSKSGPDGTSGIRYASFISQLKRIALQFNLQLQSTTLTSDGVQRMAFAWRLTAECFSIQLNYHKCSSGSADFESGGGGLATFDEFVTITSVLFEFNHDKILPCPELIPDLNSGNFDSLSQHVTNLVTVYAVPGNKIDRARAYMCLEAIEQDLSMLSQVSRSPDASVDQRGSSLNSLPSFTSLRQQLGSRSDVFALRTLVNQSMVGHFVGRSGGRLARLTYLVTPAQAAVFRAGNPSTGSRKSSVSCSIVGKGSTEGLVGGHVVRVGLRPRITYPDFVDTDGCQSSGPQQLAFIPLVTLQEDAHGNRLPDFAQPDDITCVAIEAEFVLYLDPPVPLTSDAVHQLQHITGLTDSDFGILDSTEEQDLVQVILSRHGQQHLYGINSHLQMPNMTQHSYEIRSNLRGFLVSQVPFTCSSQLSPIISLLRQHASASAFLETFVLHPRKPVVKDDSLTFHFAVTIESTSLVHVQFDHPCDVNRTVQLDIEIGQFEVERTTINCDHYISDQNQLGNPGVSVDPLPILARSHALPVGLVWILTTLGCPTHRQLPLMITKPQQPYRDGDGVESSDQSSAARFQSLTSPKLLGELRSMLARARSHVIIQDATGTGGVLSGADRFAALDLEAPLMPTTTVAPTSGLKMAPLPPGVLATPPPMFSNSEGHPGDLVNNVLSNVRYADFPARSHPNVMHSASSPQPSFNPRSLRLDDLLIDNLFQQCPGPSHSSASADHTSTGSKNTISAVPGGTALAKQLPGTRDLGDSLSSPPTLSVHAPLLGNQAGVFSSSSLQVGPQQSSGNANYPLPPYAGRTGQTATPPAVPLSIPGTFTQTPILVSQMTSGSKHPSGGSTSSNKSSTSNNGSMLVNLLNEDPLPPSNPSLLSHLPHPPSSRGLHLSSSQTAPMIPGVLDSSRESFMPNRLQSSAAGSSPPSAAASGMPSPISQARSVPTTGSQHITTAPPGLVTPKHSAPQQSGLRSSPIAGVPTPSSTIVHKTIPTAGNIQTPNTGTPTISKKPRKRRRGSSDGLTPGTFPKSGSLVSSTPQSVSTHGMKHQRMDTPTCQHPTYHRSTYGNTSAYGHVASTVTSPSQSNLTALPSVSHSSSVVSSGKSVYDFDDTASSMFELSSSSSVSSFSGSTMGASATKISSSSGASYSASGSSLVGAPGPPCAQVSANAGLPAFERTVERKTSLKISIKTLPPQRPAGKSAVATSCIVKQDSTTAQPAATEGRVKLTASGQPVKKRKRRSVDGKPSSYVLQMLQNSGGPGNVSDADGSTSAGLTKSSKCSTSLSHATLIVKKERKRRAAHGADRFKPLPPTTPLGSLSFSSSGDGSGSSMEEQKARKLERMIREGETPPQVLKVSGTSSSSGLTMTTPIKGLQTQTGVQKKKPVHAASPAVPEDSVAVKRPVASIPSSSLAHPGEYKRKKSTESSKSFLPTSYSLPQSGSESEFTNTMTISSLTSGSTHSIPVSAKVARSSHLGVRGGASTHGGLKRTQTASPFLPVSTSVPASSHASGGIIKGYKIPKKKSTTAGGALPPPILSDDRLPSTVPPFDSNSNSKGTLNHSTDSAITEPCSSTTATSSCSFITTLTSITTSQPGSPIQASPVTTQQSNSTPSKMVFTTSGSGSVLNPFGQHQQQQNRRQSVKSISDIVDKLRAKSTTGNNSSVTPSSRISGVCKLETNNELLAVTESEQSNSPIGPLEIIGASNERDTPQDPRGDNIFEKFSIETPNSSATTDPVFTNRVSVSTASLPQGADQDNLSASSPKFVTDGERQEQGRIAELSDGRHLKSESAGLESDEDVSVGERDVNLSGSRPTGQYVVIKAQTDTPASPAESCTTAPSTSAPTSTTTSKIIPISSPNGTQRLHASHSRAKTSDRHGGPLISRKTAGNPIGSRFPRPSLGSVGPISHVGPEGYMRSATAGRLRRPTRGYPHAMHRPKTATFKGPSVWPSSGGLEFGTCPPTSQGDSVQPVVGAPWMMSQGGGPLPAPTTGPPPFPSSSVAPPPPMPHSFHTAGPQQRPLRPLFGPPGGVNLYGGPMRGAGKQ